MTSLGTKLYMKCEPNAALTVTDVLKILCFCFMTLDVTTLKHFFDRKLNDLDWYFSVFVSSQVHVCNDKVEACIHCSDRSSCLVVLDKNNNNHIWEVVDIGRLTSCDSELCSICNYCNYFCVLELIL